MLLCHTTRKATGSQEVPVGDVGGLARQEIVAESIFAADDGILDLP